MKSLRITVVEDDGQEFSVDTLFEEANFLLGWRALSLRYLIPAIERIRHRRCGYSPEHCQIPEAEKYEV